MNRTFRFNLIFLYGISAVCFGQTSVSQGSRISEEIVSGNTDAINQYQLALPKQFPKGLPNPLSNMYYPVDKSYYARYENIKNQYQDKILTLEKNEPTLSSDSLLYYIHDVILIREVLAGKKAINTGTRDDSTAEYIRKQKLLAHQLRRSRFELEALNRLILYEAFRGDNQKALTYALERVALYENGFKPTCRTCNTIPKAYAEAARFYLLLKDQKNAQSYYLMGVERTKAPIDKEYALQNLAAFYLKSNDAQKALDILEKIERDSTLRFLVFETFKAKASALLVLKKYEAALTYTNRGLEAEQQFRKKSFSRGPYDSLFVNIYLAMGQPYNALKYSNSPELIDMLKNSAEQDKALQNQKLVATSQQLELEKLQFDIETKRNEMARNLEKARLKAAADQEILKHRTKVALLDQALAQQSRVRLILYAGLGITALFSVLLFRNNRQKKQAYLLLHSQSQQLNQQKEELQTTLENLSTAQTKLVQSEKLASLGELTAGIAHEIQNPLNFVNNFSEINIELLTEMTDDLASNNIEEAVIIAGNILENEKKIVFHGRRADSIVKGMLQHSRASSGEKEPVDINVMVDEYLRLSYHGMRARDKSFNTEMHTDYDKTVQKINVIPQEFGRVLLNLFTNAFYSVGEKKKFYLEKSLPGRPKYEPIVFVKTRRKNDRLVISIRDNGMGIPQKVMNKIFQPFFTTKPTGEGTGLGLSMSYDIIKGHNGELRAETQEGEFAEFVITIPV